MRSRLFALLVAIVALCAHAAWYVASWTDDAYITLRYARRFAVGEGMTFNDGERFEGITNLGWAILLAPFGDVDLFTLAQVYGGIAGVLALASIAWWGRRLALPAYIVALATVVVPAWVPSWMMQGLETGGVTLALTAGWVAYLAAAERPTPGRLAVAGVILGLGPWLRPDVAALPLGLFAWHLWSGRLARRYREWPWTAIVPIVLSAGVLVLLKVLWFGEVLPNTFHLKVDHFPPDRGLRYLWSWFTRPSAFLPLFALAGVVRAALWARARDSRAVPGLVFAAWLVLGTLQNGDFMANYRFFTPAWPAGGAAIALLVHDIVTRTRWGGVGAAAVVMLALVPASRVYLIDRLDAPPGPIANLHPAKEAPFFAPWAGGISAQLIENVPFPAAWSVVNAGPSDTVAYTELGLFSYVYDGAAVDLLGLTDRVLAGRGGEDEDEKWAYIAGRVNWLIIDTHLPAWNRWGDHLAEARWTVVAGCSQVWVFANPALPGRGPTDDERRAAVAAARRRAPRQAGFLVALDNELRAVDGGQGGCGSRESRVDTSAFRDPARWPARQDESGLHAVPPPEHRPEATPVADPDKEPPPSVVCHEARAHAGAAWADAAELWEQRPGLSVAEARRTARAAARAATRPDALAEAESAHVAARALTGEPDAVAASARALEATKAAVAACGE